MAPPKRGLDIWLETGRKVNIGGREFLMMPLPLSRLKKALSLLDERTQDLVRDFVMYSDKGEMNLVKFAGQVLDSFNSTEIVFAILTEAKDPDTNEPINKVELAWLDEHLDIPTLKRFIVEFMELNEIEEVVKNLKDLPMVAGLVDAMTMTYGIGLLKSSQQSMGSPHDKSEGSQSPKSTPTSNADTIETQERSSVKIPVQPEWKPREEWGPTL